MKLGLRTHQTDPNNLASENYFIESVSSPFFDYRRTWLKNQKKLVWVKTAFRTKFMTAEMEWFR